MKFWPTSLTRLLLAMMLSVVAFVLAPSGAQAHPGHDHTTRQVTVAVHQQHADLRVDELAPAATAVKLINARAHAAVSPFGGSDRQTAELCPGGCCHSGGPGCCAAWLSSPLALFTPHASRLDAEWTIAGGTGVTPDALAEPPKSLV